MDLTSAHRDTDAAGPEPFAQRVSGQGSALTRAGRRALALFQDPVGAMRDRIESMAFDYPVPVVVTADIAMMVAGISAAALRVQHFSTGVPFLAVVVLFACYPLLFVFNSPPKPAIFAVSALTAQALFLLQPVSPDCSPLVLAVMVAMIAAIGPRHISLLWMAAAMAELLLFFMLGHLDGMMLLYLVGIVLGWTIGQILWFQRQALYQEREYQTMRATQAADNERRRIAREVHDVIAHSLSVTLLHLTAARHALETDRDVDEAIDALGDAERLGRQAMADIRHTVGLLDQRPSTLTPEPGLADIEDLVADFVGAGMPVTYSLTGETGSISASTGLALYRISQESLSNIAKHAPGSYASLDIAVTESEATVDVRNPLPTAPARAGRGMGIGGMRQRTSALGGTLAAGRSNGNWQVLARIPLGNAESCRGIDEKISSVREALTSLTRRYQEGM